MLKILIMGLPGSGKTTLASKLKSLINAQWLNADAIRKSENDWDFSEFGRLRQAKRMSKLADKCIARGHHVICDFVCPTKKTRKIFDADIVVWMNTINESQYKDTNQIFVQPISANDEEVDFEIREFDADSWAETIAGLIRIKMNTQ
jgi:adenylylsulfate kinase